MKFNTYEIILTNGIVYHKYIKQAFNQKEATILAQAEAIQNASGYELISVVEL